MLISEHLLLTNMLFSENFPFISPLKKKKKKKVLLAYFYGVVLPVTTSSCSFNWYANFHAKLADCFRSKFLSLTF